jgi:hypothetical protein
LLRPRLECFARVSRRSPQPAVTDVAQGGWYPEDAVVFGLLINGVARAYPKSILKVHRLVNDRLGARAHRDLILHSL